ncbi:MAG: hypothetical protein J3R72DRAFT_510264 [Linnemannia gamsii]|nr:MAG: hypothetical protein J3R72DRAFT_510264 [Linnemannia gamsii]
MSSVPSFFMTEINDQPNYDQAAAYLSARVLTIGGVILFFLGLCCIGAVLLRFNRQQHLEVQRIEFNKECVLDQDAIHRSLPVRIWPSQQQYIMDSEGRVVAFVQQVPSVNMSRKGDGGGSSGRSDSDSGHSKTVVPKPIRKGLVFVERLCHRGESSSGSGSVSVSSAAEQDSQGIKGGIPMTTMNSATSPALTQDSYGRRASYAESTLEEVCCSICLCEYVAGDRVRVLPCTHEYHAEYVWLTNKSTQCPLCKRDLLDDLTLSSSRPYSS